MPSLPAKVWPSCSYTQCDYAQDSLWRILVLMLVKCIKTRPWCLALHQQQIPGHIQLL